MGQCESVEGVEWSGEKVDAIAHITYYGCLIAAAAAAAFAALLSFFLIYKHLSYYSSPYHQRYIIRVLLMCPFYAIDSWFSFRWPHYAVYFDIVRDCYEAFVIYNFFLLLLNSLGGMGVAQKILMGKRITLPFPFNCIKFTATGTGRFLTQCKNGMLQYVVIRPITTLAACFANVANVYCPSSLSPKHMMFYTSGTNFISVSVAMYALIAFYYAVQKDLTPVKPLPKFLSIKFVIFFSFWQGCVISGLMKVSLLRGTMSWSADDIGVSVQSFLICCEMLVVAVIHIYAFDYEDYMPSDGRKSKIWKSIRHVCSLKDLLVDLRVPIIKFKTPEQIAAEREAAIAKARERVSMQMHLVAPNGSIKVLHSDGTEETTGGGHASGGEASDEPLGHEAKAAEDEGPPSYFDVSAYKSIQAHELSDGLEALQANGNGRDRRRRGRRGNGEAEAARSGGSASEEEGPGEEGEAPRRASVEAPGGGGRAPPRRPPSRSPSPSPPRGPSPASLERIPEPGPYHHGHHPHAAQRAARPSLDIPAGYNPFLDASENPFASPAEPQRARGPPPRAAPAPSNPFLADEDILI